MHPQVTIAHPHEDIDISVDVGMRAVLLTLWSAGIDTLYSCQGRYPRWKWRSELAYISFASESDLRRGIEILEIQDYTVFTHAIKTGWSYTVPDAQGLYPKAKGSGSGSVVEILPDLLGRCRTNLRFSRDDWARVSTQCLEHLGELDERA